MEKVTIDFARVAAAAGFTPGPDGRLNLPTTQDTADRLSRAALGSLGEWEPGDPKWDVTLTGAGPIWGHLVIAHAIHGLAARLTWAAPNADVTIYSHGVPR